MATDLQSMQQIISSVFDSMLDMPTTPIDNGEKYSELRRILAAIRITGAINEQIVVEAPVETACAIGETMFAADPGTLADDEISDAVGEIVNMIGGNVKGMHEGDSLLSLPCVSEQEGYCDKFNPCEFTWVAVGGHPLLVHWQDMEAVTA